MVTYTEGGKTKTIKTKDDGRIDLLGCLDPKTIFKIPGYCDSAKLEGISNKIVEVTKFTSKILKCVVFENIIFKA